LIPIYPHPFDYSPQLQLIVYYLQPLANYLDLAGLMQLARLKEQH